MDRYDEEPLTDRDDPLPTTNSVLCTPHVGYVARDECEVQFADIFDRAVAYAAGRPTNVANPKVLSAK